MPDQNNKQEMSMTDEKNTLVPVEERGVEFYEDELQGVIVMITPLERRVFVPVRPRKTPQGTPRFTGEGNAT
jgi:hypothetical protein